MSDTPIYDALEQEYLRRGQLKIMTDILLEHASSIDTREFELSEVDAEEVPAILAGAAQVTGNLLAQTLADRQAEVDTDRELAAYVGGIIDTLDFLITLPPPPRIN